MGRVAVECVGGRGVCDNPLHFRLNFAVNLKPLLKIKLRDFPGGPVAKMPCSQWRRPGFDPWSGN